MAPQASEKCGLLPPDHKRIAYCTSRSINSEKVRGRDSLPAKSGGWLHESLVLTMLSAGLWGRLVHWLHSMILHAEK